MKQIIIHILTLILSCASITATAQNYQVQFLEKLRLPDNIKEAIGSPAELKKMVDFFNNMERFYTLDIQNKKSHYKFERISIIDSSLIDTKGRSFAYNSVKNHLTKFVGITPSKSKNIKFYQKIYLHLSDWEIDYASNKTLMGFKVYKATLKDSDKTVAWFCPEIPVSDGPNVYSGLPGLILEVQSPKAHITAIGFSQMEQPFTKISWNDITILDRKEWIDWTTNNRSTFNVLVE